jgi:hypothetical protein
MVIPEALSDGKRWLLWREEVRKGKPTKVPYCPDGRGRASSTDPDTWGSLDEARSTFTRGGFDGIGIALGNGLAGVDLDDCRVPETGEIAEWAQEIIDQLNSYTELSPSGTGVHVLLYGTLSRSGNRRDCGNGHVEIYDHDRYFTFTGEHLEGTPVAIEDRQAELDALHLRLFPDEKPAPPSEHRQAQAPAPEVGALVLRPDAKPPHEKLEILLANDDRFRDTWNRGRRDLHDQSASGYDMALATATAQAGWSEQEIANLLIAHRLKHGDDPKLRQDYYQRTIHKAMAATRKDALRTELYAGQLPEDREQAMHALSDVLDLPPLVDVVRVSGEDPLIQLDFGESGTVTTPAKLLPSKSRWSAEVFAQIGRVPSVPSGPGSADKWRSACHAIHDVARKVDAGPEATIRGATIAMLRDLRSRWAPLEIPPGTIVENPDVPFIRGEHFWFRIELVCQFVNTNWGTERINTSVLTQRLRMAGAERGVHRISAAEGDTKTARFWGVPIEVLDDDE